MSMQWQAKQSPGRTHPGNAAHSRRPRIGQKEFLQALGDLDIERKEISRIESLAASGSISSKSLLDRQYSRDKLESLLRTTRIAASAWPNGPSDRFDREERRLLTEIKIVAPHPDDHSHEEIHLGNAVVEPLPLSNAIGNRNQPIPFPPDPSSLKTISLSRLAHEEHGDDHDHKTELKPIPICRQARKFLRR